MKKLNRILQNAGLSLLVAAIVILLIAACGSTSDSSGTAVTPEVVEEMKLGYKAEMSSEAQGVFAIGDTENSYLFQVRGLADTAGVVATIVIADTGGNELAQVTDRPVVYEEATGMSIVGAGFRKDDVNFSALSGQLSIKVVVKVDGEVYAEKTVVVATANAEALYSWRDLQAMKNNLAGNYTLQNDIAFPVPGTYGFPASGFVPIGEEVMAFSGTLNGNGKIISDLYINAPSLDHVGLFAAASGRIENLHIEHSGIKGNDYVGTVAGHTSGAEIEGVSMASEGIEKVSGRHYVGGLVGKSHFGLISGYVAGTVMGGSNVGGLVGDNFNSIIVGFATGTVSGSGGVGGLVGVSEFGRETIVGYATGDVRGGKKVGGLTGTLKGRVVGYVTGAISGSEDVGGLVSASEGTVTGYWDLEITSDGDIGIGISSTKNIYYYTAASEPSGRVQNMYYDKGTGTDPGIQDAEDDQIFNDGDFASIFELPKADGVWPKLKESFTVGDKTITLTKAMYDAQNDVVNWPSDTE